MNDVEIRDIPLCQRCALCCDGTLFHHVVLKPGDRERLGETGVHRLRVLPAERFEHPCPALTSSETEGGSCGVYETRPAVCRRFACKLLGRLERGETTEAHAMGIVRELREVAATLHAELGAPPGEPLARTLEHRALPLPPNAQLLAAGYDLLRKKFIDAD